MNCAAAMLLHRHMTITLAQKSSRENEYRRSGSRVAVVVPNYNHGHFIGEALSSIAAQTRAPDVVLIIDDASTDDSIAIISSFIDCHPTWQLIRHNVRQGVVIGQNEALRQLDVDWVTFLGADDILHSSYIERAGKQIELAPDAVVICGCCETIGDVATRTLRPMLLPATTTRAISASQFRALLMFGDNYFVGTTTMFRRSALLDAGGFDPALGAFADGFQAKQLAARFGMVFIPDILGYWRTHGQNYSVLTSTNPSLMEEKLRLIHQAIGLNQAMFPTGYSRLFDRRARFGSARLVTLTTTIPALERARQIADLLSANGLERRWLAALLLLEPFGKWATLAWLTLRLRPMSLLRLLNQLRSRKLILARTSNFKP